MITKFSQLVWFYFAFAAEHIEMVATCFYRACLIVFKAIFGDWNKFVAALTNNIKLLKAKIAVEKHFETWKHFFLFLGSRSLFWVWWSEQIWWEYRKFLHVRVVQLANRADPGTLKRMSSGECWMGVVYK